LNDVIMKNEITSDMKYGNYVINLQSSTEGNGSHWVALIYQPDASFYCDSFGAPPVEEVIQLVKRSKTKHFAYNQSIIQDLNSEVCGYYAMGLFLYVKHNKGPLFNLATEYINEFDDDTKRNVGILKSIFRRYLPDNTVPLILRLYRQKK
jgi:hypothetical protein